MSVRKLNLLDWRGDDTRVWLGRRRCPRRLSARMQRPSPGSRRITLGAFLQFSRDAVWSCLDAAWVALGIVLIGLASSGIWRAPDRINHDCALYLQEAGMLLDGAVPYCGFVETNPPLVIYLNVPPVALARLLGVSPILVFHGLVLVLLVLSTVEMHPLLAKRRLGFTVTGRGLVLLAWIAMYFLVDRQGNTGQREQLFVLLYVPFLLLRVLRSRGGATAGWFAGMLGAQAGVGVALKPHFLLIALGVESVLLMARRRGRFLPRLLAPEIFALMGVVAAYVLHWLFVPAAMREAFVGRWLPLVLHRYAAYDLSYRETLDRVLHSPLSAAAVFAALAAAFFALKRHGRLRQHLTALSAMASTALLMFMLQRKGWSYQAIPFDAAGLLCLAVLVDRPRTTGRRFAAQAGLAAVLCVLVAMCSIDRLAASPDPPDFVALRQIVEEHTSAGDRVLIVATSVRPAYPMLLQTGRMPGSRYLCSFPVAFFYADGASYRHYKDASPEERQFLDELADDVARLRPRLIIVHDRPGWLGLPENFNTFDYLAYSGWTARALATYRQLPGPDGWKVFEAR